jgi:DNA-binding CsgD family transcriptional regulator
MDGIVHPTARTRHPESSGVRLSRVTLEAQWVLDDLGRLALRAPTRAEFFDEAAARLKRAVPFDGACWHTLDPGSYLITQHRLQDIPDRFPVLAHNEYAVQDVNKFESLARAKRKASTLHEATDGRPERSPRFRELLTPNGAGPELRSAFVADGTTWGALILIRRAGEPEFDTQEVELLDAASSLFARAVRRGLVTEACVPAADAPEAPGVVELDAAGGPLRISSTAEPLLEELAGGTVQDGVRSAAVQAVAGATRSAAAEPLPTATVKTAAGRWLVLHGGRMGAPSSGEVVVFLQRAHATLVAPLLLKAHGLTPREQDVAQLALRGATAAQAARRLAISPHTVNDHLKAIFDKTGARTRGELSATLFFGEHLPRIQDRVDVGDDASFVDAPRPRGVDPAV